jgi:hypothetical protein
MLFMQYTYNTYVAYSIDHQAFVVYSIDNQTFAVYDTGSQPQPSENLMSN